MTLAWAIVRYFLERKHKKQDERNLEIKEVLSQVLSETTAIKILLSEFLFLYRKNIKMSTRSVSNYERENPFIQFAIKENLNALNPFEIKEKVEAKINQYGKEEITDFLKNSIDYFRNQEQYKQDLSETVANLDPRLEKHILELEKIPLSPNKISLNIRDKIRELISLIRKSILDKITDEKKTLSIDDKYKILQCIYELEGLISEDMKKL